MFLSHRRAGMALLNRSIVNIYLKREVFEQWVEVFHNSDDPFDCLGNCDRRRRTKEKPDTQDNPDKIDKTNKLSKTGNMSKLSKPYIPR